MSTRSTAHFKDNYGTVAIIYRHSDGYPSCAGREIKEFLEEVSKLDDTRFNDPAYLAAKYVVFLSAKFNVDYDFGKDGYTITRKDNPLDFLSVGILDKDPDDIEYRYHIVCNNYNSWGEENKKLPEVICESLYRNWTLPLDEAIKMDEEG